MEVVSLGFGDIDSWWACTSTSPISADYKVCGLHG